MFKKEKRIFVSYSWSSKTHREGHGNFVRYFSGKFEDGDLGKLQKIAQQDLIDYFKDNVDYFDVAILNIVRIDKI